MSHELVPLDYARDAYNVLHGTELATHDGLLTYEQAAAINNHFDIEIYTGAHGGSSAAYLSTFESAAANDSDKSIGAMVTLPTQAEYDAVETVIDGIQPGDTLFIEAYGFQRQPDVPITLPEGPADQPETTFNIIFKHIAQYNDTFAKAEIEGLRQDYKISAWQYADQLAQLKGVRVVWAGHDAYDDAALREMSGKSQHELRRSEDQRERAIAHDIEYGRDLNARNIVKDYALDHLSDPLPEEGARKPRLVLLYGDDKNHKKNLREAFANIRLEAKFVTLASSSLDERIQEQSERSIPKLASTAMRIATNSSALDSSSHNQEGGLAKFAAKYHSRKP